jgi:hypothetical protein
MLGQNSYRRYHSKWFHGFILSPRHLMRLNEFTAIRSNARVEEAP